MSGGLVSEKTHRVHAFQCREHQHPVRFRVHRAPRALESAHRRIAIDSNEQGIAKIPRIFEVGDMAHMKDVETSVGHDQLFAASPQTVSPFGQLIWLNDFIAEIHRASLPLQMPFANSKNKPRVPSRPKS